ncbi:MAG: ABC transporter permease [Saccharofermentans sp.]|nr:ABC transporter permease [Saccharofermentans sp.]
MFNFISPEDWEFAVKVIQKEFLGAIWDTLYITILSTLFAILIGLPLGIILVTGDKKGIRPVPSFILVIVNGIINILRSVPFLILMILVIPVTRAIVGTSIGTKATVVPLVFAAFPFAARLVESSLREVNPNIIEMAQSMGASPLQIVLKVLIPESVPSLISNATIAFTTVLGYSAMSGILGGGGLGKIAINYGYYRYQTLIMIFAVILLIIVVQVFQTIGTKLAIKSDKRIKN